MFDKTYDAQTLEPAIAERWERADAFRAGAAAQPDAPAFAVVIPPPNVTGSLHMGHALNNTIQDILVRRERMRGRRVLWQPGLDHAGIATQMVVERRMAERGEPSRREIGREAFVQKVWEWKDESGGTIVGQLKRLGASCDWSRERFTMDGGMSDAVMRVFVELYRKGLIYKDKRLVNWDPKFETAISDLEVENRETDGHMWHFKYPLADGETYEYVEKDEDGNVTLRETRDYISIATTRPETMLGDGAVAVHPDDERYGSIVGKLCEIPVGPKEHRRRIPIITDEYPDPAFGSGAVKITGAHDFNDYQVARRNGIPLYRLMDTRGAMRRDGAPYSEASARAAEIARVGSTPDATVVDELNLVPESYRGLDRFEAREKIVAEIDAEGLMIAVEDKAIMQPFGDRSGVVIEPMLTDQWFADAKTLAEPAIDAVREGRTRFVPENWSRTYYQWMENIEPWCISRQLWWGHRIPAWYGPDGSIFVERSEEEAVAAALAHYVTNGTITDEEARGMASDPVRRDGFLHQDEDVLDTWFSSALWPFSTLGWPDETDELKTYYPTSVLVTGFDIIFFWVARMMMMGLEFMEKEPFDTVYVHALVRDKHGAKMSKSKGNVVDPLTLIDEYGADALRFTLAILAAQGRDVKLDPQRIAGYRNFGTKLWNATRFAQMNGAEHGGIPAPEEVCSPLNRWILTELSRTIGRVDQAFAEYRFNDAAAAIYRFTWNLFCDWYVELAKPTLLDADGDPAASAETRRVLGGVLDAIYALLHPFMPFITERLFEATAPEEGRAGLLCHAFWPDFTFTDEAAAGDINWLVDLVGEIRSVRGEMNVPNGAEIELVVLELGEEGRDRLSRYETAACRLARLSTIRFETVPPAHSVQLVVGEGTFAIPLAGIVDLAAERQRLSKAAQKAEGEIARLDKKLANERFTASAPEALVTEEREKREAYAAEAERLRSALSRLG